MILGCKIPEKFTAHSATAPYGGGLAAEDHGDWLEQAAAQFRAAITLHIPEGYQDETGFHYGREPAAKNITVEPHRRARVFVQPTQF
jgi:hypothetical protein